MSPGLSSKLSPCPSLSLSEPFKAEVDGQNPIQHPPNGQRTPSAPQLHTHTPPLSESNLHLTLPSASTPPQLSSIRVIGSFPPGCLHPTVHTSIRSQRLPGLSTHHSLLSGVLRALPAPPCTTSPAVPWVSLPKSCSPPTCLHSLTKIHFLQ